MTRQTTESSFDELTRGLASGTLSRGRALKLMGAALAGGALASLGIREAAADPPGCKRNGKKCKRDEQCCSGNCSSSGTCVGDLGCNPDGDTCSTSGDCCSGNCSNGFCCASGKVGLSNGTCALPCNRFDDCPACGSPLGATCSFADVGGPYCSGASAGRCGPDGSCPAGQFCSGGDCVVAC